MTPEDDPLWPECNDHTCDLADERHWCAWTRQQLIDSIDANFIEAGLRYCVPVVPDLNIYAEVNIDADTLMNGKAAMMWLVQPNGTPTDPFGTTTNETLHSLGMWTRGEGRLVMASSVKDWMIANAVEKCEKTSHGFEQEMQYQQMMRDNISVQLHANSWCLAFYEMCYICFGLSGGNPNFHAPQIFTAAEFGLGADNFTPAREQSNRSQGQQQRTRDLLRQRFGN